MNKKAMLMVVCLLCTGLFTADTLQALELADLPSAVQETVKRELGSAYIDEIERDTEDGKVVYKIEAETTDGREIELEVAEDGTLLEKKEEVRLTDVPAAVHATIERELGGVSPEKIERQTEEGTIRYEVDAEMADGREIDLDVAEDGTLLEKKEEVPLTDVPAAVLATIKRELGGVMPEKIERVTEEGTIHYEVEAEVAGKDIELEIGEDGTLLDKDVEEADDELPGLIGGQFGSKDFTDLEHLAHLNSLERSWSEDDDFGREWAGIWQGFIVAAGSGEITFSAETDKSVQILIAGKEVVAADHGNASGSVSMTKGKEYPIEVRYVREMEGEDDTMDCYLKVQWSWAGQDAVSIGAANLKHTAEQEQKWTLKVQEAEEADDDDDDSAAGPLVSFKHKPSKLEISIGGKPFATYVHYNSKIPRPYFAHVKTPSGIQATRHHPPREGKDSMDHDTFHPGIWLTFAGINGNDYWRLKKKTEHEMFIGKPEGGPGRGSFTVSNYYLDSLESGGNRIAHELCRYTILVRPSYYLLIYDSTISSDVGDLVFGDDQEYGVAIRVATPIEQRYGGQVLNADGLTGLEKGPGGSPDNLYGKASDWCDYSGVIEDTLIGMTVMPDPKNFRRSWYHVRDSGLIAANPFGRKGVAGGKRSEVTVKKGEKFHLGFGVAIYSEPKGSKIDRKAMYQDYLKAIGAKAK